MKRKYTLIVFLGLAVLAAACSPNAASTPAITQPAAIGTAQVTIANFAFDPAQLQVKVGTTVTWTNNDSTGHTVTADDGTFTSSTLKKGDTYSFTFNEVGAFAYYCKPHGGPGGQGMSGVITVVP